MANISITIPKNPIFTTVRVTGYIASASPNSNLVLAPNGTGSLVLSKNSGVLPAPVFPQGFQIVGADGAHTAIEIATFGNNSRILFHRSNGTLASPTATLNTDPFGSVSFTGRGSTAAETARFGVGGRAAQDWTDTAQGSVLALSTILLGTTMGYGGLDLDSSGRVTVAAQGTKTIAAWGTYGAAFSSSTNSGVGFTITDSTSSGTVAAAVANSFAALTFAASSATTFTNVANLYIGGDVVAGTNVTLTNSYGLWNVGKTRLDSGIYLGGTTPGIISGSSGAITLTANGTDQPITFTPSDSGTQGPVVGAMVPGSQTLGSTGGFRIEKEAVSGSVFPSLEIVAYRNSFTAQAFAFVASANGTKASPTTNPTSTTVGGYRFYGRANSAWKNLGNISIGTSSTYSDSDQSSVMVLGPASSIGQLNMVVMNGGNSATGLGRHMAFGGITEATVGKGLYQFDDGGGNTYIGSAWGANGAIMRVAGGGVITDSSSSGTVAVAVSSSFTAPTFAASSATTFTAAANVYISGDVVAGTNVTLASSYGLWNVGKTRFDGNTLITSTSANALAINQNAAALSSLPSGSGDEAFRIDGANSTGARISLNTYAGNANFIFRRADGTGAVPTAVQSGELLGAVAFAGYGVSTYGNGASIACFADEAFTESARGSNLQFRVALIGAGSIEKMRISSAGNLLVGVTADTGITGTGGLKVAGMAIFASGQVIATNAQTGTTYQVLTTDFYVTGSNSSGITVTLIAASGNTGRVFKFKNLNSGVMVLDATGLGQIFSNAAANTVSLATGDMITLTSNGTTWLVGD